MDEHEAKESLEQQLSVAVQTAKQIEASAKAAVQAAKQAGDVLEPLRAAVVVFGKSIPDHSRVSADVRAWQSVADDTLKRIQGPRLFAATEAITNTASSVASHWPADNGQLSNCRVAIAAAINRLPLIDKAQEQLRRFGLDVARPGEKSPVQQLADARSALDLGVSSETGALIALRGCIDGAVAALLPRRPLQEPAKKIEDKISSIGRQLGRDGIAGHTFTSFANDAKSFNDELGGAKFANYSRQELIEKFNHGVQLLVAILSNIDESKFRK